ncbi:hypothetical protein M407DRAFT_246686 [Tulasnella calospora MUT 4182]|uniref:Uncharacterized protein n=1 Tax=Tulasnella calospora MUT 4182 TaxID=1051891 RepID=A0A0C3PSF6_9AGAM|nr:hypothetical protein M407DRAFT_246686 [Tulasnella calospora MUT 4182]
MAEYLLTIRHGELWLIATYWVALLHYKNQSVGKRITAVIGQLEAWNGRVEHAQGKHDSTTASSTSTSSTETATVGKLKSHSFELDVGIGGGALVLV